MTARILLTFSILFLSSLLASGCAPTDEHVMSFTQRLQSGRPIKYDKSGQQPAGCHNKLWTEARISKEEVGDLLLWGRNYQIRAGLDNCYRIGDAIPIYDNDDKKTIEGPAMAVVEEIILVKPKARNVRDLENTLKLGAKTDRKDKASKEFEQYLSDKFMKKLNSELDFSIKDRDGTVQVTKLRYVRNSAPETVEDSLRKGAIERFESSKDFYEEVTTNATLSNCKGKTWDDVQISKEKWDEMIKSSQGSGWQIVASGPVCFKALQKGIKVIDSATAKTTKVQLGTIDTGVIREITPNRLKPEFFKDENKNFESIKKEIEDELSKARPGAHINIFEYSNLTEVMP